MPHYEADRNTLLSIGLLSASIQSVLSKVRFSHTVNEEQKRILRNARNLAQEIREGKLSRPSQDEYLSLPKPTAAKVRKFAIWAWTATPGPRNSFDRFDNMMQQYLELFEDLQQHGALRENREELATQAGVFFGKLNQVVVDKLNGMVVEEESPASTTSS